MSDRQQLVERFIRLKALSLVLDKIADEVFRKNVERRWLRGAFAVGEAQRDALAREGDGVAAAARVELAAAHMFAELSAASEWLAAQARRHAARANEHIVREVARGR